MLYVFLTVTLSVFNVPVTCVFLDETVEENALSVDHRGELGGESGEQKET